jgi:hypothetical protein
MIKLGQKVSGCLRTLTGAQQFCAIRCYLATTAKHGIHFFAALTTGDERDTAKRGRRGGLTRWLTGWDG